MRPLFLPPKLHICPYISSSRVSASPDPSGCSLTSPQAMIIGANENTFLQRGSQFDVMRNVEGGIEDAGG